MNDINQPNIIEKTIKIQADDVSTKASKLIAEATGLTQAQVKDAMQKGAVWLRSGKSQKRIRRATKALKAGDELQFNYNAEILNQVVPEPTLIHDAGDYSIWFKPFGLGCQGSRWGDFSSMARWIELNLAQLTEKPQRPVFLVHRLDRATTGLMVLCHSKHAARTFSQAFAEGNVDKRYQAIVKDDKATFPQTITAGTPIDGKASQSIFTFADHKNGQSLVDVKLLTGRKHQIRKHLSGMGFPIVGDRLYGEARAKDVDLQLQSVSLAFDCPLGGEKQVFKVGQELRLKLP